VIEKLKAAAHRLEQESYALYLAYRDLRTPWYARVFAALVVAHTFSPIDLIPDFIPILGYLDDLIITPLGIYLALKMIPSEVMSDARQGAAQAALEGRIHSRVGILIVVTLWAAGFIFLFLMVFRIVQGYNLTKLQVSPEVHNYER
jgi:uncharacterized membrane protein YkvA (DUF1232 family)